MTNFDINLNEKITLKKLIGLLWLIILLIILASPFIYVKFFLSDKTFWDNTFGNLLATVLALVAGIPIALWVDRQIKKGEEEKKYFSERKREKEVLLFIKEELEFSYKSLFLNGKKGNTTNMTIQPLKSDLWDALISSEETKYVENSNLLNRISSAYYILKVVKNIEEQAYIALRTSALSVTLPDGTKKNAAQMLLEDARTFDTLFENNIKEALKAIDKRLKEVKKYED